MKQNKRTSKGSNEKIHKFNENTKKVNLTKIRLHFSPIIAPKERDDEKLLHGGIVICHLCDKQILLSDNVSCGMQTGTAIHMDCHITWLSEKIKGRDV